MLIDYPKSARYWTIPLTPNLKVALDQVKTDAMASRENFAHFGPYRRRNAIVICSEASLRGLLIEEAFKSSQLFILDWKGRTFSRDEADTKVLALLSTEDGRTQQKTICIFDPELMDRQQIQTVSYCVEQAPMSVNFVFVTASPKQISYFFGSKTVVFDTRESANDADYRTAAINFFNNVFRHETEFALDKEKLEIVAPEIADQPPDFVAHLAVSLGYAQVEILAQNQFRSVEGWLAPALETSLKRVRNLMTFD